MRSPGGGGEARAGRANLGRETRTPSRKCARRAQRQLPSPVDQKGRWLSSVRPDRRRRRGVGSTSPPPASMGAIPGLPRHCWSPSEATDLAAKTDPGDVKRTPCKISQRTSRCPRRRLRNARACGLKSPNTPARRNRPPESPRPRQEGAYCSSKDAERAILCCEAGPPEEASSISLGLSAKKMLSTTVANSFWPCMIPEFVA